jgi:hypothetical protein
MIVDQVLTAVTVELAMVATEVFELVYVGAIRQLCVIVEVVAGEVVICVVESENVVVVFLIS